LVKSGPTFGAAGGAERSPMVAKRGSASDPKFVVTDWLLFDH
jgi:hypothetical protein